MDLNELGVVEYLGHDPAKYRVTVIVRAVLAVTSDRCDWFSGRRRADSSIASQPAPV